MGQGFIDRYSVLHFAAGIIANFWNFDRIQWFLAHFAFEIVENTAVGMSIINSFPFWPGGKDQADAWVNILGDNLFAVFGHWFASYAPYMIMGYIISDANSQSGLYRIFHPLLRAMAWTAAILAILIMLIT